MIKSVKIENFRQFDKFELDGFKRVNFLVGKNDCGKTSILEALVWVSNPINIKTFELMTLSRNMMFNLDTFSSLFYKKNESVSIDISANFIDNRVNCSFTLGVNMSMPIGDSQEIMVRYNELERIPNKKEYDYSVVSKNCTIDDKYDYKLAFNNGIPTLEPKGASRLKLDFRYFLIYLPTILTSLVPIENLDYIMNKLELENKFIKYLQVFNEKITRVGFWKNNQIFIETTENDSQIRLALNLMGDGFVRFFIILISLVDDRAKTGTILIDEIENGLHFSSTKKLLQSILDISKEMNIQMFITTHSYETLKFLSEIVDNEEDEEIQKDYKENIQVINIAKTKLKGFKSYNYSMDGLINFIATETEIRK